MAISNYTELKAAISEWLDRTDIEGNAADFVTLAEARLNRLLDVVEAKATLTGISASRTIDISAYKVIEPVGLFVDIGTSEVEIDFVPAGTIRFIETSGQPAYAMIDNDNLIFDCPLDQAYSFRFRYRGRFALSDAAPTNDLLTEHPDVYLAACIVWGGVFIRDRAAIADFKTLLDEFIAETQHHIAKSKRGVLRPNPEIAAMMRC